jgi:ribonuclease Z
VALFRDVTLLVSEGTYGADEDQPRALERKHMTFREAAELARAAGAGELLLTHFSPSLADPSAFADRATAVFPRTTVGHDHLTRTLAFPDA